MGWIRTIEPGEAEGALRDIYGRIAGPDWRRGQCAEDS